ncbi:MAG: hypothetical protein IM557_11335, partial [Chitinophagaceae bacterium]|nr:hypothetical protein [Chitinophagaceae bacterium]
KAAMYFDAGQPEILYEQCLRLYKDESLKTRLITEGIARAQQYSWEKTARELNRIVEEFIPEERKESETTKS